MSTKLFKVNSTYGSIKITSTDFIPMNAFLGSRVSIEDNALAN